MVDYTFRPEKGAALGTEEVLWVPGLVQSSHYFLQHQNINIQY